MVVGMIEDETFEEQTIQLEPGDILVAFSDGITEARDLDGEEFAKSASSPASTPIEELANVSACCKRSSRQSTTSAPVAQARRSHRPGPHLLRHRSSKRRNDEDEGMRRCLRARSRAPLTPADGLTIAPARSINLMKPLSAALALLVALAATGVAVVFTQSQSPAESLLPNISGTFAGRRCVPARPDVCPEMNAQEPSAS